VTIQIQSRHVRHHIGKENTSISLMDWKIVMFDHEGVIIVKKSWSLSILFLHDVKSRKLVSKIFDVKGPNMHNPNQFMASQNLHYNFLNEFLKWYFL